MDCAERGVNATPAHTSQQRSSVVDDRFLVPRLIGDAEHPDRLVDDDDRLDAPRAVAIVSESTAQRLWPGLDPLAQSVRRVGGFALRVEPSLLPEEFAEAARNLDATTDDRFARIGLAPDVIMLIRRRLAAWPTSHCRQIV